MPTSPRLASAHSVRASIASSLVVELRRLTRSGLGLGALVPAIGTILPIALIAAPAARTAPLMERPVSTG